MHTRLPVLVAFLLLASCRVRLGPGERLPVMAGAGAAVIVLLGTVTMAWRDCGRPLDGLLTAIPDDWRGRRVLPVILANPPRHGTGASCHREVVFWHWAALTVVEHSTLNPLTFSATPLQIRPDHRPSDTQIWEPVPAAQLDQPDGRWWADWRHRFDRVLFLHPDGPARLPVAGLVPVYQGPVADLYRIDRAP
ncbi:hypothetical protein [Azospirillum sp. B4]|uniref:hypothetical protein n=1 Tax=Azospirillum sp. B4 TaxID=95605 RepID=UPI0011DCB6C9|nr:hypothetical protein [Azospirillum sp. B4]